MTKKDFLNIVQTLAVKKDYLKLIKTIKDITGICLIDAKSMADRARQTVQDEGKEFHKWNNYYRPLNDHIKKAIRQHKKIDYL